MYLQITTRCNMTCEHCCYNCTNKGEDMSLETVQNALEFFREHFGEGDISIGGGEPTIHPKFWQIFGMCMGEGDVWLATNGSQTKTALALCAMARRGIIGCALSRDPWHDPIDEMVLHKFTDEMDYVRGEGQQMYPHSRTPYTLSEDRREVRDVSRKVSDVGRAHENGEGHTDHCVCDIVQVRPSGSVFACGCEDAPCFGDVNTGVDVPDQWDIFACHREQESEVEA